mmetsp:Transcript_58170/g.170085  ORF Transcript_58170/g.170085 Transcript_58170/m.170085 type:complete len:255 (-) Transcript_58170:589-1353(-)
MPAVAAARRRRRLRNQRRPCPQPLCHLIVTLTLSTATIVWRRSGRLQRGHGAVRMAAAGALPRNPRRRYRPQPPCPLIAASTMSIATTAWRRSGPWPRGPGVVRTVAVGAARRLHLHLPQRLSTLTAMPRGTIGSLHGQFRRSSGVAGRPPEGAQTSRLRHALRWIVVSRGATGRPHGASKRRPTVANTSTRGVRQHHHRQLKLHLLPLPRHRQLPPAHRWTAASLGTIGRLHGAMPRRPTAASMSGRDAHLHL